MSSKQILSRWFVRYQTNYIELLKSDLSGNIGNGSRRNTRHAVYTGISRTSGLRFFINGTRGCKYVFVSLNI